MPLKYADVCKVCHTHRTQDPSGICSRCRRLKGEAYCKICGKIKTSNPDGICHKCRKGVRGTEFSAYRIDDAIEDTKLTLFILERRKEKESFAAIAEMCGLSKSACYERFCKACGRADASGGIDTVDGTFIAKEGGA